MKCIKSDPAADRCDRCIRLQRDCVYESHRRGMWRREQMEKRHGLRDTQVQPSGDTSSGTSSGMSGTGHVLSREHAIASSSGTLPDELPPSQSRMNKASFIPPSFITHTEDTRGLSLGTVLDPQNGILNEARNGDKPSDISSSSESPSSGSDPINLRLISRPSAQYLFEGFFKHFNCLVGLLDPHLYTFSYTRETSSLLFSTVLAISARVFQPESCKVIRQHSETLLGRVLLACDTAVENIWAIACMYHWKDVDDTRGYTLLGFALRMAASAEWNKTRGSFSSGDEPSSIAQTEVQVRQRRDKARVWLALGNLDRTSSLFTDRPLAAQMVNKDVAARSWLSLEKWTYPLGDGKAVGGYELTQIARPVYEAMMKSRHDLGFELFRNDMDTLNVALIEWADYWRPTFLTFPNPEPFQTPLIYFFRDYMRLYFNSVLLHRLLVANNNSSLDGDVARTIQLCFSCALGALNQVIEMGKLDILYYLWDTAHLMTAYSAMMVLKLLKQPGHLPPLSTDEALQALAEVSQLYSTAAGSLSTAGSGPFQPLGDKTPISNPVGVQARLLGAVYEHLKSEYHVDEQNRKATRGNLITSMSSIQDHTQDDYSYMSAMREDTAYAQFSPSTGESTHSTTLTTPQDLESILDSDFMDVWFNDAGLLSWDQPGIFIEPH